METGSSNTPSGHRPKSDMQSKPQTEKKHPDEWEGDLNPNRMAGQNIGEIAPEGDRGFANARDVKDVHRALSEEFGDDELRQIPIVQEGERLKQGASYLDLGDADRREFTATGDMSAAGESRLVPKDEVPYSLWNRLRGVDDPERIPERGER